MASFPLFLVPILLSLLLLASGPLSLSVLLPPSWSRSLPLFVVPFSVPGSPPPLSFPGPQLSDPCPHLSQALCWPPLWGLCPSASPLRRLAVLGRSRWCFSLGSAVQLLPGTGQLADRAGREVPSWGVPLAGPSRLGGYRGVTLWSEPSVHTLRQEAGAGEGEQPLTGQPPSSRSHCPLVPSARTRWGLGLSPAG